MTCQGTPRLVAGGDHQVGLSDRAPGFAGLAGVDYRVAPKTSQTTSPGCQGATPTTGWHRVRIRGGRPELVSPLGSQVRAQSPWALKQGAFIGGRQLIGWFPPKSPLSRARPDARPVRTAARPESAARDLSSAWRLFNCNWFGGRAQVSAQRDRSARSGESSIWIAAAGEACLYLRTPRVGPRR